MSSKKVNEGIRLSGVSSRGSRGQGQCLEGKVVKQRLLRPNGEEMKGCGIQPCVRKDHCNKSFCFSL